MRLLLTALAPLTWGTTYIVTTELLPADRPLLTGALRALPAGLLLLAAVRTVPRGSWWWRAAALGTLNIGAFFPLLFLAAYRLPGGVAAVLGSVQPLVVIGLSAALLGHSARPRAVAAGLIGVAGVALVVLRPQSAGFDALGLVAGLVGAGSMAAGTVLGKRWGRPEGVGPLTLTAWQLTVGGLLITPLALAVEGLPPRLSPVNLAGYGYLAAVNTALAYWLWWRGLDRIPAASAAFLSLLSPVTAVAVGWAALGQSLTPVQVTGVVLALGATAAGVVTAARRQDRPSCPAIGHGTSPDTHDCPATQAIVDPATQAILDPATQAILDGAGQARGSSPAARYTASMTAMLATESEGGVSTGTPRSTASANARS
ncbi:EamA family transporter [Catellatospora tritici]|uniref:EamA family transporter n=1 Tax=Catellatospora tritici TaxID=2851566 RepID=UPI001C2D9F87|nr:EamA family transporter [Catellatospora tritici]MBV1853879.1 DMT family transporter [Catellatospora tritici]